MNHIELPSDYTRTDKYNDLLSRMNQFMVDNPAPSDKEEYIDWWCDIQNTYVRHLDYEKHKILKKAHKPKAVTYNFLTLSPKPMLALDDADRFHEWIESIMNPRLIDSCQWVVECGKDTSCPNIHCHILFNHKNEGLSKNFKRDVCRNYCKHFGGNIDWNSSKGQGWHNVIIRSTNNPMFNEIINDKVDYLSDFNKGAIHKNFKDLGLCGGFGRVA